MGVISILILSNLSILVIGGLILLMRGQGIKVSKPKFLEGEATKKASLGAMIFGLVYLLVRLVGLTIPSLVLEITFLCILIAILALDSKEPKVGKFSIKQILITVFVILVINNCLVLNPSTQSPGQMVGDQAPQVDAFRGNQATEKQPTTRGGALQTVTVSPNEIVIPLSEENPGWKWTFSASGTLEVSGIYSHRAGGKTIYFSPRLGKRGPSSDQLERANPPDFSGNEELIPFIPSKDQNWGALLVRQTPTGEWLRADGFSVVEGGTYYFTLNHLTNEVHLLSIEEIQLEVN